MTHHDLLPSAKSEPAVGVDLGTTYSLVAYLDSAGRPTCLPNAAGDVLTPSVVLADQDRILVGKEAIKGAACAIDSYADCFKRDLGRPAFRRTVRGKLVPPEVLSALVLERLRLDAEHHLGPLKKAVITVPAYFDELCRKATQDAGRLAGWEVLDIINEPIAAALCCGFDRNLFGLREAADGRRERIVVYDLGGGTFDVSLLEVDAAAFRTLATDGDVQLGGKDFDERLVKYLAEQFLEAHGLDPCADPRDAFQLWQDAEAVKHALTEYPTTSAICLHAGIRMRIDVSRQTFEELTRDLLERTLQTTEMLVRQAGFTWAQIDRVLLSGGAIRMPMVASMLRELTGKEPDRALPPDEGVARGAAIYAGMLLGHGAVCGQRRCELIHVNSHSLGAVGVETRSMQRVNAVLIPRNTPIPAEITRTFKTKEDGQRSVVVPIVEGESERPEFCTLLGKCVVRDLPPGLPKGTRVEVSYRYLANGRLAVSARLPGVGYSAGVEIVRDRRTTAWTLSNWKAELLGRPMLLSPEEWPPQAPLVSLVEPADRDSNIKRSDALYERIGRLAARLAVPPNITASQQTARCGEQSLDTAAHRVAEAERHRNDAVGGAEMVQFGAELSQARQLHRQAASDLAFAYLILGRECVEAGFCPPGGERDLEEVRRLKQYLE
jgi:molecular chaperone DnaK